jgi:hypothetical protein
VEFESPDREAQLKPGLKERAKVELVRFVEVSAYLFVAFAVLLFYRNALLQGSGVSSLSLGFAAGKAMILAKFLLLGESARLGRRFRAPRLWIAIVRQAVLMWILLIVLSVLEEFLVGLAQGHSLSQTLAGYESNSVLLMLARSIVLLIVLLPMIATLELSKALGPGVLRGLLTAEERKPEEGAGRDRG